MAIGKTKAYNTREFERILLNNGFEILRTRGSHIIYKRNNETITINEGINKMVCRRLLKTYNLVF